MIENNNFHLELCKLFLKENNVSIQQKKPPKQSAADRWNQDKDFCCLGKRKKKGKNNEQR